MKDSRYEFRVGVIVLLALIILVSAILWGKQFQLTTRSNMVDVRFQDISGLVEGAQVMVNGVKRGKVAEMILEQDGVIVKLSLSSSVILYNDAYFEVMSPELMGGKVVNIFPGISGVKPPEGFMFTGNAAGDMNELMRRSSDLVEDVKNLLQVLEVTIENINKTAGDPTLRDALRSGVRNLDQSSQKTLEFITLNEDKMNQVMDNLVKTTESLKDLVENSSDDVDKAVGDFEVFISQLNELAGRLNQVADKLQSEEGTLGMLINDDELAVSLKRTIGDVDSLVQQIRKEGIQTNISLFGRRKR